MKNALLALLFFILAAAFVVAGVQNGGNVLIGGIAMGALFAFLGIRKLGISKKKTEKPKRAPSAKPAAPQQTQTPESVQPQPQYHFVNFRVAGTSFKNDDGTDRQVILHHIKFNDPPYVTGPDALVEIKPYTYEGEQAYKCLVNGYMIGSVPRNKIQEVAEALKHDDAVVSGIQVTGGGTVDGKRLSYGCDIAIRYAATLQ